MTVITSTAAFWPGGRGLDHLAAVIASPSSGPRSRQLSDEALAQALTMKGLRPLSRTARLAMVVAVDAWPADTTPGQRDAVVLATRNACVEPLAGFVRQAATAGPSMVFPMSFPNTVASVHAGYVAILLGLTGPNITICGDDAGRAALARGMALIEADRADRVMVVAAEAAEPTVIAGAPDVTDCAAAVLLERTSGSADAIEAGELTGQVDAATRQAIHDAMGDAGVAGDLMALALQAAAVRPVISPSTAG